MIKIVSRRAAFLLLSCCLSMCAYALDTPSNTVVLTVSGKISQTNRGADAVFDMAMLEKLPQHSFTTNTPWYPTPTKFTGPLLRDVLAAVGAVKPTNLIASAVDDYRTNIPASDTSDFELIVARLINDQPIPLRGKGPLFIVYNFDSNPELKSQVYRGRSAWQLKKLQVE